MIPVLRRGVQPSARWRRACSFPSQELDELLPGQPGLLDDGEQGPPY